MSLDFQQLEEGIERLINNTNYAQFQFKLQDNYERLTLLREEYERDPSQIEKIEAEFCSIKEEIENIKQRVEQIEFVNRLNEIQTIKNNFCPPYLLIDAPPGYGKTRLLETVEVELQQQHWVCIHLSLSRKQSYSIEDLTFLILQQLGREQGEEYQETTPEEAGYEVSRCILNTLQNRQKNVMFIVDETESIHETLVRQLLNQFIPAVKKGFSIADKSVRLRLICAGRYISLWEQWGSKVPLKSLLLTPFDFEAVYETVENFDSKNKFDYNYKQDFAAYLMYFTGGHPACMANTIKKIFGFPIGVIVSKENEYYESVIIPVIEKIKAHISDKLVKLFETLSAVRRFNARLLGQFIKNGLIEWSQNDGYELEDLLLKTYLVSKKDGFLCDDITRRILAVHLRRTDLIHYCRVCEQSIAFYESELKDPTSPNPAILAVELLFQKLQMFSYTQQGGKEQFLEGLPEILNILVSGRCPREREIMDAFTERLNDDWEFRFMFNYLLREGIYDHEHPFQKVMQEIANFMQFLQGGKHYA